MASKRTQDLTDEDMDALGLGEVFSLLGELGLDLKVINDPTEAKETLKQKVREVREEAEKTISPEQVIIRMADVARRYKTQRELLLQCCRDAMPIVDRILEPREKEMLRLLFGRDALEVLQGVLEQLSQDDCPILVAGETSAGKSTLLNLLLGDDILPVAHMSSTSTICELKYGEDRQMVVHHREPDLKTGSKQLTLNLSKNLPECQEQLAPYIHSRKKERKNLPAVTKIEVFWPLDLLKGGVTIVDSPGVGESDMMDEFLAKYIPSAFAFIYIIDSSRAGGVQHDRFGRLLLRCKDHGALSELEQFDPRKAIFVCNKWDLVPLKEREEVREEIICTLEEMWEGLNQSQVFIHSNTEAVKGGLRSLDFNKLLDGIYDLLPQGLNHKISTQYRRMVNILKEMLTYINLKRNNAYRNLDEGERCRAYVEAKSALAQFDENMVKALEDLKNFLKAATEKAAAIVKDVKEKLLTDHSTDPIEGNSDGCDALKQLDKIRKEKAFREYIKDTKEEFLTRLRSMVSKVKREHDDLLRPVTGRRCSLDIEESLSHEWFRETIERILSFLRQSSKSSETPVDLDPHAIASNHLERSYSLLSCFEANLQASMEVDKRLMEDLFEETRSQLVLASKYDPQAADISRVLGRLVMVDLEELREYEYDFNSIIDWKDSKNRIAVGSYGEVYRVHVERNGSSVLAALKVGVYPYDIVTEDNAWRFLAEDDNLRTLKGDHIVEYYGTVCMKERNGLKMGLLMELCEGTLHDRIIGQKEHNPACCMYNPTQMKIAFNFIKDKAIQLCEGLRTIHDAGYIHRDLKLSNILVTAGDVVKLADVGETKKEEYATGTITGTAMYAAPEVKGRKVPNKSADIYSLGLILWEMWYGRTVWDAMNDPSLKGLMDGDTIMMPHSPPDYIRPIRDWATLVRDCMNKEAKQRPTVLECLEKIRAMVFEDGSRMLLLTRV